MAFRLQLLGPPELHHPDGSPVSLSLGKPLALLVYVACHPDGVRRNDLASLLWPEASREKGRHSVRQGIWVLKNACGEELLDAGDPLKLRPQILETDLDQFREALGRGDIPGARSLWKGPFLDTFYLAGSRPWDHWVEELRADLDRRFHKALLLSATEHRQKGRSEDALDELDLALRVNPASWAALAGRVELLLELLRLDEAREALVDAHRQVGDQPEVRETLQALEEKLAESARIQRAQLREVEGFPLEFVGRSRELAGLRELWTDAEQGRSRVAVITGPSGIGKTRMGQEFGASLTTGDALRATVRGSRAEMKLRWGGAADLVRQLLLFPGSAGISSASDALLRAMIPSLGKGEVNLQTVNGVSPAALLDATTDLVEAVTFEAPLLVILDDFQWFDGESRTLLAGVMRRVRELRALFLALGRSDLSSRSWEAIESELESDAGAVKIPLSPLGKEEVQELLGLVANFPDPDDLSRVGNQIHRATGGNPLFIRSVLQELSQQGILVRDDDEWVFHSRELPLEYHFPESVGTVLGDRLDRVSEEARRLAGALARRGRGSSVPKLKVAAGLDDSSLSRAVAQLLEMEIVDWVDDTTLDFSHDLMRQAAADRFPAAAGAGPSRISSWIGRHRGFLAAALAALITLHIGMLWGRSILFPSEPEPVPYGGGTIQISSLGSVVSLEVGPGHPGTWKTETGSRPTEHGPLRVYRGPDGAELWFSALSMEGGPDMIQVLPDGSVRRLAPGPGDQVVNDVSPDGTRILFTAENLDPDSTSSDDRAEANGEAETPDPWSESIYTLPLEGGPPRLIFASEKALNYASWSGSGDHVAAAMVAAIDTLAVFSLDGERIASLPFLEIAYVTRCGTGYLVADRGTDGKATLVKVDLPGPVLDTVGAFSPAVSLRCSPDGRALVYAGIQGRRVVPLLRDFQTGETYRLPAPTTGADIGVNWLPDDVSPVVEAVDASQDTLRIAWGERGDLRGSVVLSDGSRTEEGLRWTSLNPSVATVHESGVVVGNSAGTTSVIAAWGHSFRDTVRVEVLDRGQGGAFIRERFDPTEPPGWTAMGDPPPELVSIGGQPALHFRGDEKYNDGIRLDRPVPLDQGVTVELDLRMEITRDVHQNFGLCLNDRKRPEQEASPEEFIPHRVCLLYPAVEFEKRNLLEFSLNTIPGISQRVMVPKGPSGSDWTHIAIQVRADGEVSLIVNHDLVLTNEVVIDTEPAGEWVVELNADALGTDIFVKDLTVWREVRYAPPGTLHP